MISRGHIASTLAALATVGGCGALPQPPPPGRTVDESRGRHILQIASACGCHGSNFAGWREGGPDELPRTAPYGERFIGSFGKVPARNITPDTATGIAGWTDAQIAAAITDGVDPSGESLSPVMPCRAYHGMARSDIAALVAYLHCLHPVHNSVPEPEPPVPDAASSPAQPMPPDIRPAGGVELGHYLVRHVCVCADCHSPDGSGSEDAPLTGKVMPGRSRAVAPNITPDRETGIGAWSAADTARYLRTGSRPDGGVAQAAMAGLILTSFSHFTPEEADGIAAYLKSLPPVRHRAGAGSDSPPT
jgi:mono/diheme cytochrome c family protein